MSTGVAQVRAIGWGARPRSRRAAWLIGAGLLVMDLVAGLLIYDHWLTHPDALITPTVSFGAVIPMHADQTFAFDTGVITRSGPAGMITLDAVSPIVTKNTAAATITMRLCPHRPGNMSLGDQPLRTVGRVCLAVRPIDHQTLRLNAVATQVFAVVTPHKPGSVRIRGFNVTYHQGRRHQTEAWTATSLRIIDR